MSQGTQDFLASLVDNMRDGGNSNTTVMSLLNKPVTFNSYFYLHFCNFCSKHQLYSPKREKTDCQYNLQYAVNYINYEESNVRKGNVIRSVKEYVSLYNRGD